MEKESTSFWADIKKYEDILAKDPRSYCFAPLSELYRKLNLLDDAVTVAKRGIEAHPEYIGGFMALGRAQFEQGNRDEAKVSLEKVVLATPENLLAQRILSQIYQEEGSLLAAERALQLLVGFNPEDTESSLALDALRRSMQATRESESFSFPAMNATEEVDLAEPSDVVSTREIEKPSAETVPDESFYFEELEDAETQSDSDRDTLAESDTADSESGILPLSTITLAELYEGQGFLEKALEVYSDLLTKDPDNQRLKERASDLMIRLERESDLSSVSELSETPEVLESGSSLEDSDADLPGDSACLFPNDQGHNEVVLDQLGLWLDAVRRRKECR
jgi:tetratricopeptide (TPR) repeat protein